MSLLPRSREALVKAGAKSLHQECDVKVGSQDLRLRPSLSFSLGFTWH